jgi:hypothetical protein
MNKKLRPIALLTDFGLDDWYVGAMKGEVLRRAAGATIIDISHGVAPQQVRAGAFMLDKALDSMPGGTVFCCVVDPGVGTARRALCGRLGDWFFCGPDNGLLTPLHRRCGGDFELYTIERPEFRNARVSATFHGRDVFAPAAAQLALGVDPREAGPAATDPVLLTDIDPEERDGVLLARVVTIDRFGNLVTNLPRALYGERPAGGGIEIRAGRLTVRQLGETFGTVGEGEPIAYWGSGDTLEIAVNQGSAAQRSALAIGGTVEIVWG